MFQLPKTEGNIKTMNKTSQYTAKTLKSIKIPSLKDKRIAILSTYLPRKCGIGIYTKDLASNLNLLNPSRPVEIIAMDAQDEKLVYPSEVSMIIHQNEWQDYVTTAKAINNSILDLLLIQHEFGIFGGTSGELIVDFIKLIKKPIIITLHTVLQNPNNTQKRIISQLSKKAQKLLVMLPSAVDILVQKYQVSPSKIEVIPLGTPNFSFVEDTTVRKDSLGLKNKIVMSSINFLSRGKGFEYVIQALADIVKKYPNFTYLIIGQTHPTVLKREGEIYRKSLEDLVKKFKLTKNVKFVNQYISTEKAHEYIQASDFYITPYDSLEQISSASLSSAIAAGKICISTSFRYAAENLSGDRGYLIGAKNALEIRDVILHGLKNTEQADTMRKKCYSNGRLMVWPKVSYQHLETFDKVLSRKFKKGTIPHPKLEYIKKLTNKVGIFEHSGDKHIYYKEGYATDDNARALIVSLLHQNYKLSSTYLGFLESAQNKGQMYCDKKISGQWEGKATLGDHFGRSVWAVCIASLSENPKIKNRALLLLEKLLPKIKNLKYLRPKAFCLIGLSLLLPDKLPQFSLEINKLSKQLCEDLIHAFSLSSTPKWLWFENTLTYDNPRLSQSLLAYANVTGDKKANEIGLKSLNFLVDQTYDIDTKCFRFVGCNGWFSQFGTKALDDEQPLEASATIEALAEAYQLTKKHYYIDLAEKAFAWYHGDNIFKQPLYNSIKSSVYDGLGKTLGSIGVSRNQGAESVLSYNLAFFAISKIQHSVKLKMAAPERVIIKNSKTLSKNIFPEINSISSL